MIQCATAMVYVREGRVPRYFVIMLRSSPATVRPVEPAVTQAQNSSMQAGMGRTKAAAQAASGGVANAAQVATYGSPVLLASVTRILPPEYLGTRQSVPTPWLDPRHAS